MDSGKLHFYTVRLCVVLGYVLKPLVKSYVIDHTMITHIARLIQIDFQ